MQVNDILESLLQQLQAHNNPHVGAVQAAMNLAGGTVGSAQRDSLPQVLAHVFVCAASCCSALSLHICIVEVLPTCALQDLHVM